MKDQLETPLWSFAVSVYGALGVQDECLDLQDRFGVDVNLLLFAAYAGAVEGLDLTQSIDQAAEAVSRWHQDVVRPLRHVRRSLKSWSGGDDLVGLRAGELREQVKARELDSERIELLMLWTWLQSRLSTLSRSAPKDPLIANIHAVLIQFGIDAGELDLQKLAPRLMEKARQTA
jgi:uncharacterized protein (TIGR02444 family)